MCTEQASDNVNVTVPSLRCYGEGKNSWSRDLLRRRSMYFSEQMDGYIRGGWRPFRTDFQECFDAAEVIKKVSEDRNGIGFFEYTGQPLTGTRVLNIGKASAESRTTEHTLRQNRKVQTSGSRPGGGHFLRGHFSR